MKFGFAIFLAVLLTGCVQPAPKIVLTPEKIPGGKVGVEYAVRIDVKNVSTPFQASIERDLPPGLELEQVYETGGKEYISITGTPEESGDFEIALNVGCPPVGMLHEPAKGTFKYSIRIDPSDDAADTTTRNDGPAPNNGDDQ